MSERYQKNLKILKQNLPFIYDKVTEGNDQFPVLIHPMEGFKNDLLQRGEIRCYGNSLYDINGEMTRYFEGMDNKARTVVVLGAGSGYVLEHISRNFPWIERVVLVEPSLSVFKSSLQHTNYEKYLSKFGMTLIINSDLTQSAQMLGEVLEERLNSGVHVVTQHSFASLFSEFYTEISDLLMRVLRRQLSQASTSHHITYLRLVNILTNLKNNAVSASELIPLLQRNTVFVVSAGPSLDKNLGLIEEAKKKGVVIGVGTAIEIMDQKGIQPHFRAAFSPHVDTTIFKKLNDDTVPLIYLDTLFHDIISPYQGELIKLVADSDPLTRYALGAMGVPAHVLITEMSIANIIIEFCLQVGAPRLVLLGQDMAYSGMKMYAEGSLENQTVQEGQSNLLKEKGYNDEKVFTDIRFISMRDAIVRSIMRNHRNPATVVVNCTEGGLNIPLTEQADLNTLLDAIDDNPALDQLSETVAAFAPTMEDALYEEHYKSFIEKLRKETAEIEAINEERVAMVTERIKEREEGKSVENILKKYGTVNSYEDRLKEIPLYNEVLQYEFDGIFRAIIMAFKYVGENPQRQLEGVESMVVRICLEMRKIVNTLKMLIDEYYGIEYPVGIGNRGEIPEIFTNSLGGADYCLAPATKENLN